MQVRTPVSARGDTEIDMSHQSSHNQISLRAFVILLSSTALGACTATVGSLCATHQVPAHPVLAAVAAGVAAFGGTSITAAAGLHGLVGD